jgi:hypothetical protein
MRFHELLGPSSEWLPLVEKGVVTINRAANRLIWHDGRFAAALMPSPELGERLASLPVSIDALQVLLKTIPEVAKIGPALEALQLVSTVGAITSVANVGVSIAGFAVVLKRLNRIEGKLDQMMTTLAGLRSAIQSLGSTVESFILARLAAAKENLDRSVAAVTERERIALARDARRLFQESRLRYLELWRLVEPWRSPEIEIATAMELQGRYIASAIGELQSEFILGDTGAFIHASRSTAKDLRETMALDAQAALRVRCDAAVDRVGSKEHSLLHQVAFISGTLDVLPGQLLLARSSAQDSATQMAAFESDAELPAQLGLPGHEILRLTKEAPGVDVLALGRLP